MKTIAQFIALIIIMFWSTMNLAKESDEIQKLADIVTLCVNRHDTQHPVFHGCIDWHSAVHGHWALLWAAHRLDNSSLAEQTLARLTPQGITAELEYFQRLDAKPNYFEKPYGRAWFLQLARDAETLYGFTRLRPLAEHIFNTLLDYARKQGGDISATDYHNASWYLYQLLRWAEFKCDKALVEEIRQLIEQRFNASQQWPAFPSIRGFFDPKALAALLLVSADSSSKIVVALADSYTKNELVALSFPFTTAHQGGLNYSRSWGLWALYGLTKNATFQTAAKQHHKIMYDMHAHWAQDYGRYAHWVAQFGLFSDRMKVAFSAAPIADKVCYKN